jgi:hypothetical protein
MAGNLTNDQRKWVTKQYCIPTFASPVYITSYTSRPRSLYSIFNSVAISDRPYLQPNKTQKVNSYSFAWNTWWELQEAEQKHSPSKKGSIKVSQLFSFFLFPDKLVCSTRTSRATYFGSKAMRRTRSVTDYEQNPFIKGFAFHLA